MILVHRIPLLPNICPHQVQSLDLSMEVIDEKKKKKESKKLSLYKSGTIISYLHSGMCYCSL